MQVYRKCFYPDKLLILRNTYIYLYTYTVTALKYICRKGFCLLIQVLSCKLCRYLYIDVHKDNVQQVLKSSWQTQLPKYDHYFVIVAGEWSFILSSAKYTGIYFLVYFKSLTELGQQKVWKKKTQNKSMSVWYKH